MNCREFVDFLMDYLDDTLPGRQRAALAEHMDECPDCEVYLETYRETVRLGRRICRDPEGPVPEDVPEGLVEAILAARRAS
ncbi:MAG: anti-sigma factor [Myxococcales bacterium]|nr:anti-sigma factor [Myxococcales bacterium]